MELMTFPPSMTDDSSWPLFAKIRRPKISWLNRPTSGSCEMATPISCNRPAPKPLTDRVIGLSGLIDAQKNQIDGRQHRDGHDHHRHDRCRELRPTIEPE